MHSPRHGGSAGVVLVPRQRTLSLTKRPGVASTTGQSRPANGTAQALDELPIYRPEFLCPGAILLPGHLRPAPREALAACSLPTPFRDMPIYQRVWRRRSRVRSTVLPAKTQKRPAELPSPVGLPAAAGCPAGTQPLSRRFGASLAASPWPRRAQLLPGRTGGRRRRASSSRSRVRRTPGSASCSFPHR
jgi:hypothetical protein